MYDMWSAMKFCSSGMMPPPTTIAMNIPEPRAVYLPKPSTERLKIQDHITDVHSPHSTSSRAASGRLYVAMLLPVNTGMSTVMLFPVIIAPVISSMATKAVAESITLLEILLAMNPATKRPTSIRNQYVAATKPATAVAFSSPNPPPFAEVSEI